MAMRSLFQRTHTDEFRFLVMAGYIEDFATESLNNRRFFDRHSTDRNAWMIGRQRDVILSFYDRLAERYGKPKGRPSNGYARKLILSAAVESELAKGHKRTAAYLGAARRLGEPMTKNKVQNAYLEFRDVGIEPFLSYLPPHDAEHRRNSLIAFVRDELDRNERALAAEREQAAADRQSRRFAPPIGGCFGAADVDRIPVRTREVK